MKKSKPDQVPDQVIDQTNDHYLHLNVKVIDSKDNCYRVTLTDKPCHYSTENCCGGYCGSQLWKKMFNKENSATEILTFYSTEKFPPGARLTLFLSNKHFLQLQLFLWLFPCATFLIGLLILPSEWWSLLTALILSGSIWLIANTLLKKYSFGLKINHL